jgi:hypothetical protein
MRRILAIAIVLGGCEAGSVGGGGGVEPDGAVTAIDGAPRAIDAAPDPDPADGVVWTTWPSQQSRPDASWGSVLTDIANHLPSSYGDQYWDADLMTAGHETTHGIQAHLRNYVAPDDGQRYNAFYVGGDHAAFVVEPDVRKSDVAPEIPADLRGPRYDLYVVGQTEWDDTPLYLFDEWNAYCNGADVAIDLDTHGLWTAGWTDAVMGPLEFSAYAIATAKAVADGDAAYFASNTQFRAFTAWEIERAMRLFASGRAMSDFAWQDQDDYAAKLRTSADAEALRAFARQTWGSAWTQRVLGF